MTITHSGGTYFGPLSTAVRRLTVYIRGLSLREQLLLSALVFAALIMAPLKAHDFHDAQLEAVAQAQSNLQDAKLLASRRDEAVLSLIDQRLEPRKAWSWRFSSFPVARVALEQQLTAIAQQSGMTVFEVKSAEEERVIGNLRFVRLDLSGPFNWPSFCKLLDGLAAVKKGVLVDAVSMQNEGGDKLHLVLLAPVLIGPTPANP